MNGPLTRARHARERAAADERLRALDGQAPVELAWRAAELTSRRARRDLARSLGGVVASLNPKWLPGVSLLNRVRLRAHAGSLLALVDRLDDDRPVTAAGMLLVRDLLTDSGSPLYAAGHIEDLEETLAVVEDVLDGR